MRRLLFACCALLFAAPAAAQTGPEPTMILTLFGGASTGHSLWNIGRQPLCVLQGSGGVYSCTSLYDTLALSRNVSTSLVFGVSGTYFKNPHVGIEAEIIFLGFPFDDSCLPIYLNPDPGRDMNQQVCQNANASSISASSIAFFGGLVLRASPRHFLSPYLRGGFGLVTYSGGTVEMSGAFEDATTVRSRAIIVDDHPKSVALSLQAAAGFTTSISPGYQFRLELHDAIVPMKRAIGAANDLGQPPTASRAYHHLVLTMGLDVVLEKKRGRRY